MQFYFDRKHRNIGYKNLKIAFLEEKTPEELKMILKKSFENFAQNFVELLCLKRLNRDYVKKYIQLEGKVFIDEAFKKGRGVIFMGTHAGNWEFSNATFALLGYPYSIVAQTQKNRPLNELLNRYRQSKGYSVIPTDTMLRQIINKFKNNEAVGLAQDHGGIKDGLLVKFFGRLAYTPTGAVRLALKFNIPLLLGYLYRVNGPYQKITMLKPIEVENTGNLEKDLYTNLKKINSLIETFVRQYPEEYLWYYKRWKGSPEKSVVILSNGSVEEIKKCQERIEQIKKKNPEYKLEVKTKNVKDKNRFIKDDFVDSYADIVLASNDLKSIAKRFAKENLAELYIV